MSVPQALAGTPLRTDFLSASDAARLVARIGITQVLRLVSEALEADFGRWQDFDKSARTAAHSASGVIELMPVADARDYAFKYVNGHPHNPRLGLPTVMAFGALAGAMVIECVIALGQWTWELPGMTAALAAGDPSVSALENAHGDLAERLANGG